jgi:hypothetical protein
MSSLRGIFDQDQRVSVSIIRMIFGILGIWNTVKLDKNFEAYLAKADFSKYSPISILQLFALDGPPDAIFFDSMVAVGYIFSFFLIIGFLSRISAFAVIVSGLSLIGIVYSWGTAWSHGYNVIFLTMIPMLFMPLGQFFSIDRLLFPKYLDRSYERNRNNGWAIFISVASVSLMYFNAFFFKIITGRGMA